MKPVCFLSVGFQWQSLQCSWTSSLELSADGPQTAALVMKPFQTVAKDVFIWGIASECSVNPPLTALSRNPILTYLLTYLLTYVYISYAISRSMCSADLISRWVSVLFKPSALMRIVVSWRNFMSSSVNDSTGWTQNDIKWHNKPIIDIRFYHAHCKNNARALQLSTVKAKVQP